MVSSPLAFAAKNYWGENRLCPPPNGSAAVRPRFPGIGARRRCRRVVLLNSSLEFWPSTMRVVQWWLSSR